jgi:UDP-glucose 4-epimerase
MRIALTGASGFLGSVLARHLVAAGHEVRALTRTLPRQDTGADPRLRRIQGDLASPRDAAALIEDAEVVVHLAWTNTPLTSNAHLPSDAAANLLPTLTLIEAMRATGNRAHVVFASSGGAVYGDAASRRPFREDDVCRPQTSYGIQKLTAEHYLRMASEHGWLTATTLRIANPYGVLLPPERRQGFIGTAVAQIRSGDAVRVFGNPANVRDYVHITDVCRAYELALVPREPFDVFNIGSGTGQSVEDILGLIREIEGDRVTVHPESFAAADELTSWVVLDVAKARDELEWAPRISLRDGLKDLLALPSQ